MAHHADRSAPESEHQQHHVVPFHYLVRCRTSHGHAPPAPARLAATALRPYCGTNGCTSFLEVDPETGVARCPICGYVRRTH